jgi:hypothetical protein
MAMPAAAVVAQSIVDQIAQQVAAAQPGAVDNAAVWTIIITALQTMIKAGTITIGAGGLQRSTSPGSATDAPSSPVALNNAIT